MEIKNIMERYWPCLRENVSFNRFILEQGVKFVAAEGEFCLMKILHDNGFVAGQVYSCLKLLDVLEKELDGCVDRGAS